MAKLKGGTNICGATIGVLCLDSKFPKPPGHIKNPSGLNFPVLYETVSGATVQKILDNPGPEFLEQFITAAQKLESEGVRAITGSCGFLALFQKEIAFAVNVPVFASSLIQIPLVHNMLGKNARVGVITASASSLTERHFKAVGADQVPIAIMGMEDSVEFREVILEAVRDEMDTDKIAREFLDCACKLVKGYNDIGALVLECTDLPPYAHLIQEKLNLPVFDLTTLTSMVYEAVTRKPYVGI